MNLLNGQISINDNLISDTLHEGCPGCDCHHCYFYCDGSHTLPEELQETEQQALERIQFNSFIDGVTSLLLALSNAGFDVQKMESCVQTALDAASNNV